MRNFNTENRSKFLKIKCKYCRNEQIIFNKASTRVNCLVCGKTLAEPTGGLCKINTKIIHSMD